MSAKTSTFEKDGKKFPVMSIEKDGQNPGKGGKTFNFTFGLSKARLIVQHIEDIKRFVAENTGGGN